MPMVVYIFIISYIAVAIGLKSKNGVMVLFIVDVNALSLACSKYLEFNTTMRLF